MKKWQMFLLFAVGASFLKRFIYLYNIRSIMYSKAIRYLQSDVCLRIRGHLDGFNMCQTAEEWSVHPILGTIMDILEDWSLCGHNRCSAVYDQLMWSIPLAVVISLILTLVYCCVQPRLLPPMLPAGTFRLQ